MVVNNDPNIKKTQAGSSLRADTPKAEEPKELVSNAASSVTSRTSPETAKAQLELTQAYRPRFRDSADSQSNDFTAPPIKLLNEKLKALGHLRQKLSSPNRDGRRCSAFIQGPGGSRVSDVLLARAKEKYLEEKQKSENASNILIIGEDYTETQLMARRLLRSGSSMQSYEERKNFANDIEVLNTLHPKSNQEQKKPKIIFINTRNLEKIGSKGNLSKFFDYVGIDSLRYIYFDHAHDFISGERGALLKQIVEKIDQRQESAFYEVAGTSHCDNEHEGKRISDYLGNKFYLGGPEYLSGSLVAPIKEVAYQESHIGEKVPDSHKTKEGEKTRKTWSGKYDYAHNIEAIRRILIPEIVKALDPEKKQKILIRAFDIKSIKLIKEALQEVSIEGKHLELGWTHSSDAKTRSEDKEVNQFINSKADEDGKPLVQTASDRLDLLDQWGSKFEILIHCRSLDGKEVPADHVFNFYPPKDNESLEKIITPARTLPDDGEVRDSEIGTKLWLLDVSETSRTFPKKAGEVFEGIKTRHRAEDNAAFKKVGSLGLQKLGKTNPLSETKALTDYDSYLEVRQNYGGNVEWLEFLDKKIVQSIANDPQEITAHIESTPENQQNVEQIIKNYQSKNFNTRLNALIETFFTIFKNDYKDIKKEEVKKIIRGLPHSYERKREVIEDLLSLNLSSGQEIESIIQAFPTIVGIRDAKEASERIQYLIQDKNLEKAAIEAAPQWLDELEKQFGEGYPQLIEEFVYKNYWESLFSDYDLEQILSILYGISDEYVNNKADAEKIFNQFLNFCQETKAGSYSAIGIANALPQGFEIDKKIDRSNLRNEVIYLEERLEKQNQEWLSLMAKSLGHTDNKAQELRSDLVATFLVRYYSKKLESSDSLKEAVSVLNGNINTEDAEQIKLFRDFISYLNSTKTPRLINKDLHDIFPEVFKLEEVETKQENLEWLVNKYTQQLESQANRDWLKGLKASLQSIDLNQLIVEFLNKQTDKRFLNSHEDLKDYLLILLGNNSTKVSPQETKLFMEFFAFITKHPKVNRINPYETQNTLGELFNLEHYLDSKELVIRECQEIADTKPKIVEKSTNWILSVAQDTGNKSREAAIERLAEFLYKNYRDILPSSSLIKAIQIILLDAKDLNTKLMRALEESGIDIEKLKQEFHDSLVKEDPKVLAIEVSRYSPWQAFNPAPYITSEGEIKDSVQYILDSYNSINIRDSWISQEDFLELASQYIKSLKKEKRDEILKSYESLKDFLVSVSGQKYNLKRAKPEEDSKIKDFYNFAKTKLELSPREFGKIFPSLISFSETVTTRAELRTRLGETLSSVFKSSNYPPDFLDDRFFDNKDEVLDFMTDFLFENPEIKDEYLKNEKSLETACEIMIAGTNANNLNPSQTSLLKKWTKKLMAEKEVDPTSLFDYYLTEIKLSDYIQDPKDPKEVFKGLIYPSLKLIANQHEIKEPSSWMRTLAYTINQEAEEPDSNYFLNLGVIFSRYIIDRKPELLHNDEQLRKTLAVLLGLTGELEDPSSSKTNQENAQELIHDLNSFFKESKHYIKIPEQLLKIQLPNIFEPDKEDLEIVIHHALKKVFAQRREQLLNNDETEELQISLPPEAIVDGEGPDNFGELIKRILEARTGLSLEEIKDRIGFQELPHNYYRKPFDHFLTQLFANRAAPKNIDEKDAKRLIKTMDLHYKFMKEALEEDFRDFALADEDTMNTNLFDQVIGDIVEPGQERIFNRIHSFSYKTDSESLRERAEQTFTFANREEVSATGVIWDFCVEYHKEKVIFFHRINPSKNILGKTRAYTYHFKDGSWILEPEKNAAIMPAYFDRAINQ